MEVCPRCKKRVLNRNDSGESQLYNSRHILCVPCFFKEEAEIDEKGTNNLPETLKSYGTPNDF